MRQHLLLTQHKACGLLIGLRAGYLPIMRHTTETPADTNSPVIDELRLMMEEETVSIASRHEQPISLAPSNVYVITDEYVRYSGAGAIDIPTLFHRISGMEVMQSSGADFNVSARSDNQNNANKLLVMVDGRSIYLDVQGTMNWKLLPVTLPEIKRIEVLKGPASAAWGFNAFDGVVNIITKSPEEMNSTTLQFGGGSGRFGLQRAQRPALVIFTGREHRQPGDGMDYRTVLSVEFVHRLTLIALRSARRYPVRTGDRKN